VLGDNLLGSYLQGSFALGAGDEHSDVDFLVVTREALSGREVAGLRELHRRLHDLPLPWAQHLEGSYAPAAQLRRLDAARQPFLYLDNGARELVWHDHCNTAVARWILREHGIPLAGPEPAQIVEPVAPDDLRAEARATLAAFAEWAEELSATKAWTRWAQPYVVLQVCRLLRTIARADVVSKQAAAGWALDRVEPRWRDLIRRALDDRPDPWRRVHEPADGAETAAFAEAALARPMLDP
jgi:hypothetical protein